MHLGTANTWKLFYSLPNCIRQAAIRNFSHRSSLEKSQTANVVSSNPLTDNEYLFEVQHHTVTPSSMYDYESIYSDYSSGLIEKYSPAGLVHTGSWRVHIGSVQNQFVHIWRYPNRAYLDQFRTELNSNPVDKNFNQYIVDQSNEICFSFSYFGLPQSRPKSADQTEPNIYEMRSYWLKLGKLSEWSNLWREGVKYRPDAKVLGLFSRIGELHHVYHIWRYQSFSHRKQMRTNAWAQAGWSDNVEYTVPLIRKMESKILVPLKHSPTQ